MPLPSRSMHGLASPPDFEDLSSRLAAPAGTSRKRPLQTYGRRKHAAPDTAHTAKKPRLSDQKLDEAVCADQEEVAVVPLAPAAPSPSKSSILRYFKRAVAPPAVDLCLEVPTAFSAPRDPASTPPTSPAPDPPSRPRSRRRLTTRLDKLVAPVVAGVNLRSSLNHAEHRPGTTGPTQPNRNLASSSLREQSPNGTVFDQTSVLCERPTNPVQEKDCDRGERGHKDTRSKKSTNKHAIQTTLSLSSVGNIMQCRECEMLYNPLHQKDVKYHARHHASLMRVKTAR